MLPSAGHSLQWGMQPDCNITGFGKEVVTADWQWLMQCW
jgi:hypothetical protein